MSARLYTEEHEWIEVNGDTAVIGISDHATEELGEIVYVDLKDVGENLSRNDEFGSIESVKTVSGLYSPVTGAIVEINETLADSPETVNNAPFTDGWLVKIKVDNVAELEELMSEEEYKQFIN